MNDYLRWLNHPLIDPEILSELKSLTDEKEIEDRFYQPLAFGTAGLRGIIGAGTNRMNKYTVRRATAGFARYLMNTNSQAHGQGVAIAYDSRHKSPEFAAEAAGVLAYYGIRVYLFKELRPTPMLSFAVRHLKAAGGIVITASHNPPEYNGYKVYGPDGAQLLPEPANRILNEIQQIEDELSIPVLSIDEGMAKGLIHLIGEEIDQAYIEKLRTLSFHPGVIKEMGDQLGIVFTPLHGTGNIPVRRILKELGFSRVHVVPEQEQPDPEFRTVSSPNPEERQAFDLALRLAEQVHADILIGTDPDADRVGVIVKHEDEYVALTGNQIGALLLYYSLEQKRLQGTLPENGVMLKTIVTSELGRQIASQYDVQTVDVLTGFKYIAEKIREYETSGRHSFVMGYEESYGYLLGDFVRDKDAVQASMMACEMAAYYKRQGLTLVDVLQQLFDKFGTYLEDLTSFTFQGKEGKEKMDAWMNKLREQPLTEVGGIKVSLNEDYQSGLHGLPPANVLKIHLADGSWIAVRPSGTEPKIKFYFGATGVNQEKAAQKIRKMKQEMLKLVV
ncbi:phospho-sugar mutase [Lihuaxuella thermophila]|uniref:Phosphoglucomutase n=1 Tax=Lihuaxuella thermophila TaxID=1173111 RepID=A0A1H8EA95_9BACL|nr:phospho-sugar mutase [Lihuaxuella thermophila]SEN16439.1 phosphoglucomutase [Lihuaxuella thermophila]